MLIVGPETPAPIRSHLRDVLANAREQPETSQPRHVAPSNADRRIYDLVVSHLRRELATATGSQPPALEVRRILRRTHLLVLDVEPDGTDTRNAEILLRHAVVQEPGDAGKAGARLIELCGELARRESHIDRTALQDALMEYGIGLQVPPDLRTDVERLRLHTESVLDLFDDRSAIALPGHSVKIARQASRALKIAAQRGSRLIVGDAGVGKTGCLSDALQALGDVDVVALAAEELEAHTGVQLAAELRIGRPLDELLSSWPVKQGVLVIDGLDAARDDGTRRTLIDLIERVLRDDGRFRVLASVRTFDLRNSERLRRALATVPFGDVGDHVLPEFLGVAHFAVPVLTTAELDQLAAQAPEVDVVLRDSPAALRELAAVPFNLRLLVELLLSSDLGIRQLRQIDTQSRLLEAYWRERVLQPPDQADDREWLLR
ncbi:MAG: hypothetical protein WAU75_20490, partial [Solirubrobacteraceae bacterium]